MNRTVLLDVAPPLELIAVGGIILIVFFTLMLSAFALATYFLVRWLRKRRTS